MARKWVFSFKEEGDLNDEGMERGEGGPGEGRRPEVDVEEESEGEDGGRSGRRPKSLSMLKWYKMSSSSWVEMRRRLRGGRRPRKQTDESHLKSQ